MKKLLATAGLMSILTMSIFTANASTKEFTDAGSFASWYTHSVEVMRQNNVITGYADGSFRGDASVTRGELAVMLERFAKALGMELFAEPKVCTLDYRYGLGLLIYDQNGNPVSDATVKSVSLERDEEIASEVTNEEGGYTGIGEGKGYYNITIEKEGYVTHMATYKFDHDGCHVIPQVNTVLLIKKA